ncbi:hypothetical protein LCGC14_2520110 [marine sediment metagenome]|uniref:DUF5675 domain-containing protein n=1 Tax=marine sediment metagenome TaxID=412755 RepID=A0A0F9AX28_9ZZZZ
MDYRILRINSQLDYSMGVMFSVENFPERVRHLCYTLEDEFREIKVSGETRIPSDTYELKLRTEGGLNERYKARFPDIHEGMIWLQNVPNFSWIYLHCGNYDDDTDDEPDDEPDIYKLTSKGRISIPKKLINQISPVAGSYDIFVNGDLKSTTPNKDGRVRLSLRKLGISDNKVRIIVDDNADTIRIETV